MRGHVCAAALISFVDVSPSGIMDFGFSDWGHILVATAEKILNRNPGGIAAGRRLGALCALAVQEFAQSENGVYPGCAGMGRFPTPVGTRLSAFRWQVPQRGVGC